METASSQVSQSRLFLAACFTFAFLHNHHPLLLDARSAAQGHHHGVSLGRGAAGAGAPLLEERCPGAKRRLRWNKEGAALAEAQLVVHRHRAAPGRRHALLEPQRGGMIRVTTTFAVLIYLQECKN